MNALKNTTASSQPACVALVKTQPLLHPLPRLRTLPMPAGASTTCKMLHGRCQLRRMQPKLPRSVPLPWVHPGPQPAAGTAEMSAHAWASWLALAVPRVALIPALTSFQLCTHPSTTTGCISERSLASLPAQTGGRDLERTRDLGRMVHAGDAVWKDAVPPEPGFPGQGLGRLLDKQKPGILG